MKIFGCFLALISLSFVFAGHDVASTSAEDDVQLTNADGAGTSSSSGAGPLAIINRAVAKAKPKSGIFSSKKKINYDDVHELRRAYENEIRENLLNVEIPEDKNEKRRLADFFVNKYFHMYECPEAEQYFQGGKRSWTFSGPILEITATQYQSNPLGVEVSWYINSLSWAAYRTDYKVELELKVDDGKFAFYSTELPIAPEGGEPKQKHTFLIPIEEVRSVHSLSPEKMKIRFKTIEEKPFIIGSLDVDFSEFKFSFHSQASLDMTGKCCFAPRLTHMLRQGLISREFFDFARDEMTHNCLLPRFG